jgi:uncharacterized BrkB/YihY/UPF0761 family membrane protein
VVCQYRAVPAHFLASAGIAARPKRLSEFRPAVRPAQNGRLGLLLPGRRHRADHPPAQKPVDREKMDRCKIRHMSAARSRPTDLVAGRSVKEPTGVRGPAEPRGERRWLARARASLSARVSKYAGVPVVGIGLAMLRRDKEAAGAVAGSAIAFRLFLFFVPLLLFLVGVAGLISGFLHADQVTRGAGISGSLAADIRLAFAQPGVTRWLATGIGLVGALTSGRSLSKVLASSSAIAWRIPPTQRASIRTVGMVAGLVCSIGLLSILVNRLREALGLGVASASLVPVFIVYVAVWIGISLLLPRDTTDPGAVLPGAVIVAATITALQALSEFYVPNQLSRANQLYGAIGTTVTTLGWFFFLGRAVSLAMELNAVLYERIGSVSTFVFSLPVLRILPRRMAWLRRFFDLEVSGAGYAGDSDTTGSG